MEIFGTRERVLFHLNDYTTKLGILNAIAVPYFTGGTTNTAAALRAMRENIFTPENVRIRAEVSAKSLCYPIFLCYSAASPLRVPFLTDFSCAIFEVFLIKKFVP